MNAKTLKKLRRAAVLVHQQILTSPPPIPQVLLGPPPTVRQVYRRLRRQEALHERPR